MSSNMSDRSNIENRHNLERFSPLMYQLKKSTSSSGITHSMKCDVIGQEPGAYAYPSGDKRSSPNNFVEDTEERGVIKEFVNGAHFKTRKLL